MVRIPFSKPHARQAGNSSRLELPGRLLRSALTVLATGLVLAWLLGLWRSDADVAAEMQSAMAVVQAVAHVQAVSQAQGLESRDDEAVVQALRRSLQAVPLRHLRITLRDEFGMQRLALGPPRAGNSAGPGIDAWVRFQRQWQSQADPPPVMMSVARPDGAAWTLIVTPDPDSERREAIVALLQSAAIMAAAALVMMVILHAQIHRALEPLSDLLKGIERLGRRSAGGEPGAAQGFATIVNASGRRPLREVQSIAAALENLERDLASAERQRRVLSLRLQSLQEDERRRIAQELHDELGQRLTALRLGARVLERRLREQPEVAQAAGELGVQIQAAQGEVSDLLRRLAPRTDHEQPVQRLVELLEDLTRSLDRAAQGDSEAPRVTLDLDVGTQPLSEALTMTLFRMSQEALTNVRRHAQAHRVSLYLHRREGRWHWACEDDGVGLDDAEAAAARGNGLAGIRERAWAFGGDLSIRPAQPHHDATAPADGSPGPEPSIEAMDKARRGLRLEAVLVESREGNAP